MALSGPRDETWQIVLPKDGLVMLPSHTVFYETSLPLQHKVKTISISEDSSGLAIVWWRGTVILHTACHKRQFVEILVLGALSLHVRNPLTPGRHVVGEPWAGTSIFKARGMRVKPSGNPSSQP